MRNAMAMENNGTTAERPQFVFSEPPPDVVQPVQIVSQSLSEETGDELQFRLSEPPADVVQPVEIVSALGQAAAAEPKPVQRNLSLKEIDYARQIGPDPDPVQTRAEPEAELILDNQEIYQIIREVAVAHSGGDLYTAISADLEYETPGQPAYQQRHFGLGFGLVLFTQASGHLGSLLRLMQQRDPDQFDALFAPHADALLTVTNAETEQARLQPVDGQPLWSTTWVDRFRQAGNVPVFQAAQNQEAIENQFRPMLDVAFGLGFNTDRGLAMVYDRVVTAGLGAGLRWLVQAAGPLRTAAQRSHALEILGFNDLAAFQATLDWTPQDGRFGPETHAALVGALRGQGQATLPTITDLTARLVAAADGAVEERLIRLRDSANFEDIVYRQDR